MVDESLQQAARQTTHKGSTMLAPRGTAEPSTGNQVFTLGTTIRRFCGYSSPRVLLFGLGLSALCRLAMLPLDRLRVGDGLALLAVLALVPFVEWLVHRAILHAKPRSIGSFNLDLGQGHRGHHLNPNNPATALLRGPDAGLFLLINATIAIAVALLIAFAISGSKLGPSVTAVMGASIGLVHYEWSHYLFHSKYQPRSRRYIRLKRNHRLHHWRNENYWLGITSNLGDRAMGTMPADKSNVPMSPTTRTLGIEAKTQN